MCRTWQVLFSRKLTEGSCLAGVLHCRAHLAGRALTDAINHTQSSLNRIREAKDLWLNAVR